MTAQLTGELIMLFAGALAAGAIIRRRALA
jgi:hypothetical protein